MKAQNSLTNENKKILLSEHNFYRKVIGADSLHWSTNLENKASQLVNDMTQRPNSYSKETEYGLNVYRSTEIPNSISVVKSWADEQKYYSGEIITKKNLFYFQHYTQIIWKQTTEIGCAMNKTKGEVYILVCLYNPKGNTIGSKP